MTTIAEGAPVRLSDKVVGRVVSAKVVGDHLEVTLAIDDDLARKIVGGAIAAGRISRVDPYGSCP